MNLNRHLPTHLLIVILGFAAIILAIYWHDFHVYIIMFLMIWGNNLHQKIMRLEE